MTRESPDAIVTWAPHCNQFSESVSRQLPNVPVVWYDHSAGQKDTVSPSEKTRLIANAKLSYTVPDVVAYCSDVARDIHVDEWDYNPENTAIVPVGVDLQYFRRNDEARNVFREQHGIRLTEPLVGMVARYDHQKDIPAFIKTAAAIAQRYRQNSLTAPHFLLCGKGCDPGNSELVAMIREAGLTSHFHLIGVSHHMPSVYSALDLTVSTSRSESFGLSAVESMACETPFVGTDVGMFKHIIGDKGLVVPKRDKNMPVEEWSPEEMANAWQTILGRYKEAEPDVRQALREQVVAYDTTQTAAAFNALIHQQIQHGKRVSVKPNRGIE